MIACLQTLYWVEIPANYAMAIAIILFIVNLADAFMDLVVDVMLIEEAAKDPKFGAEKLRAMTL